MVTKKMYDNNEMYNNNVEFYFERTFSSKTLICCKLQYISQNRIRTLSFGFGFPYFVHSEKY